MPSVPFWHQLLYRQKLRANGNTEVTQLRIHRYGHCNVTTTEMLVGFELMVLKATGQQMYVPARYDINDTRAQLEGAAIR